MMMKKQYAVFARKENQAFDDEVQQIVLTGSGFDTVEEAETQIAEWLEHDISIWIYFIVPQYSLNKK